MQCFHPLLIVEFTSYGIRRYDEYRGKKRGIMTVSEQREGARQFALTWQKPEMQKEKQYTQDFWKDLLSKVFGVKDTLGFITFEKSVLVKGNQKYIDGYIGSTKILIEQKSGTIALDEKESQSDGQILNAYEQADRYDANLDKGEQADWIITSNFKEFWIYNRYKKNEPPQKIRLENFQNDYQYLGFLINPEVKEVTKEKDISVKAGDIVGKIYDALKIQYKEPESKEALKSLNALCVRLVFCMYAEDAGVFGKYELFSNYMENVAPAKWHRELQSLFTMLNTPYDKRDGYDPELEAFPYVNGGLFDGDNSEIPAFTQEIVDLIIKEGCKGFNWRDISPTIFGAVFESTLNQEERRKGGMHFTPVENIHKVIDPLFLDDLCKELEECKAAPIAGGSRTKKLSAFQEKLASLNFLDPACGSGNFLTESFLCIRRLENEAISILKKINEDAVQTTFSLSTVGVKVSIEQFHGIEVNDFAVSVAKTAMWIAEAQMLSETEKTDAFVSMFLPLTTNANIVEGNALQLDWNEVVRREKLNYIMGNPPFVGKKYQSKAQKSDMKAVFGNKTKGVGSLDYVTAWYRKAVDYMSGTELTAAFVSTNSIVQGEHIPLFWKGLYDAHPFVINFAHQTFKWDSEASEKAAVHCVIIGFQIGTGTKKKIIYTGDEEREVTNIHPYLIEMPDVFIENRSKPLFECKPLVYGSFALDDSNYTISEEEYNEIIAAEPEIRKYLKLFIGSEEFINNKKRYCVWLKDADIREVRRSRILTEKIQNVQTWRSQSKRKETAAAAQTPMLFAEIRQPDADYMAIPITSSERRRYIPIGYMKKDIIASNHLLVLPDATLYDFGVLISNVHMAWMRLVAGRLELRYNYSARVVYNNFPWCNPTDEQRKEIEEAAKAILLVRKKYPNYTLSDMYDPLTMPKDLIKAHDANNRAVMRAYGFNINKTSEADCVAALMQMYKKKSEEVK